MLTYRVAVSSHLAAQKSEEQVRASLAAAQEAHEQAERKIAWRSAELEEQQARMDDEDRQRIADWRSTIEKERLEIDERLQKEYADRLAETIKVSDKTSLISVTLASAAIAFGAVVLVSCVIFNVCG